MTLFSLQRRFKIQTTQSLTVRFYVPSALRWEVERVRGYSVQIADYFQRSVEQGILSRAAVKTQAQIVLTQLLQEIYRILDLTPFDDSIGAFAGCLSDIVVYDFSYNSDIEVPKVAMTPFGFVKQVRN